MSTLSEKYLNNYVYFKNFYDIYSTKNTSDITKLKEFFDGIELNKNYFRTGLKTNKNVINKDTDTYTIQLFFNNLNKVSNSNVDIIISEMVKECISKKHLYKYYFDTILQKTITHSNYIDCYALIIKALINNSNKDILLNSIQNIQKEININHKVVYNNETKSYDNICNINLFTDKLYGLNILLVKLEKLGVLDNYIYDNLEELFSVLDNTGDDNTIYRVLSCLEHMSNENNCILNKSYINKLVILKESSKPKIKFKILDILEKYN